MIIGSLKKCNFKMRKPRCSTGMRTIRTSTVAATLSYVASSIQSGRAGRSQLTI